VDAPVDPTDSRNLSQEPSRERFPARARLLRGSPPDSEGTGNGDVVLGAVRRLWRPAPDAEGEASLALEAERRQAARELERQQSRLRLLLGLVPPASPAMAGPEPPREPGAEEARDLLDRARAFHEEWRQLLPGDGTETGALREFSTSPYLDLLERKHDRLWLLLDRDGCLLRAGRPQRAPEPVETGLWLEPGLPRDGLLDLGRPGWRELGPWLALSLEGGWFLVSPSA
jgi:hypothetical protein